MSTNEDLCAYSDLTPDACAHCRGNLRDAGFSTPAAPEPSAGRVIWSPTIERQAIGPRITTKIPPHRDPQWLKHGVCRANNCPEAHCVSCGEIHVHERTCPNCIHDARQTLADIARMCSALPEEAALKGIDSEAMNLAGPAADPEARANAEASYLAGRLPEGWLDSTHGRWCPTLRNEPCTGCKGDDLHPLVVLGFDQMEWEAELENVSDQRVTVTGAIAYLGRHLDRMAQWPHIDFAYTVKRWKACAHHLETVLHDGEQRDTGAPCLNCLTPLERIYGTDEDADGWKCPRCHEVSTEAQYRLAVRQAHLAEAEWLTDAEASERTTVKAGTIRRWAHDGLVEKRADSGRVVYRIQDIERLATEKGMMSA